MSLRLKTVKINNYNFPTAATNAVFSLLRREGLIFELGQIEHLHNGIFLKNKESANNMDFFATMQMFIGGFCKIWASEVYCCRLSDYCMAVFARGALGCLW